MFLHFSLNDRYVNISGMGKLFKILYLIVFTLFGYLIAWVVVDYFYSHSVAPPSIIADSIRLTLTVLGLFLGLITYYVQIKNDTVLANIKKFIISVLFGLIGVVVAVLLIFTGMGAYWLFIPILTFSLLGVYLTDNRLQRIPFSIKDVGIAILSTLLISALGYVLIAISLQGLS